MANDRLSPIVLLGSARSGTTLFQRILNSYEDVLIWGEHAGFLERIANSYFLIKNSPSMAEFSYPQARGNNVPLTIYKDPKQWQAWNNWFKKEDIKEQYKTFMESLFLPAWRDRIKFWGFKEIRYGKDDQVVDFFIDLFPKSKLVIIYRNPMNVIDSQLAAFFNIGGRLEKIRKLIMLPKIISMAWNWRKMNERFLQYKNKYPDNVVIFSFERFVENREVREGIFDQLRLGYTETQEMVLKIKEGRGSAYQAKDSNQNRRWLQLGYLPALAVYGITSGVYNLLKTKCP